MAQDKDKAHPSQDPIFFKLQKLVTRVYFLVLFTIIRPPPRAEKINHEIHTSDDGQYGLELALIHAVGERIDQG